MNEAAIAAKMNKPKWHVFPWAQLVSIGKVFHDGALKYGEFNWKTLKRTDYEDALARHIIAYESGERIDKDSGSPHTAHIAANAMILEWFDEEDRKNKPTDK